MITTAITMIAIPAWDSPVSPREKQRRIIVVQLHDHANINSKEEEVQIFLWYSAFETWFTWSKQPFVSWCPQRVAVYHLNTHCLETLIIETETRMSDKWKSHATARLLLFTAVKACSEVQYIMYCHNLSYIFYLSLFTVCLYCIPWIVVNDWSSFFVHQLHHIIHLLF